MAITDSPPRRELSGRQADRVAAVVEAALAELRANGYDGLTVRNAARRAGVAPATAYNYFASKDHLVAELFWRRLGELPAPAVDRRRTATARVSRAVREAVELIAAEPALAAASTTAVLANEPDVHRLRAQIGGALNDRIAVALDDDADRATVRAINLALSGALLQAGMGYFSYDELADRMDEVLAVILGAGS